MGYITEVITEEQEKEIWKSIRKGEVVSASKESYFRNYSWGNKIVKIELSEDKVSQENINTLIYTLDNGDFVEYDYRTDKLFKESEVKNEDKRSRSF